MWSKTFEDLLARVGPYNNYGKPFIPARLSSFLSWPPYGDRPPVMALKMLFVKELTREAGKIFVPR